MSTRSIALFWNGPQPKSHDGRNLGSCIGVQCDL